MQCPGQDNRYWSGDEVFEAPCPNCGNVLEFFKDDSQRSCKKCGNRVLNPKMDFGCAAYCPHAEQCLGAMPTELLAKQGNLFKDRLAIMVRKHLLDNPDLLKLTLKRTELAEKLCEEENGNMAAIVTAALLGDIDNPDEFLQQMKAEESLVQEVNNILKNKGTQNNENQLSLDLYHDADVLAKMQINGEKTEEPCRTATGQKLSEK